MERKIAALLLGLAFIFDFVSCEVETDNSLALAAIALSASPARSENTCKITFYANGGSITTAEQKVKAGEKATLKSASELGLERTSCMFKGWATKADAASTEYNDAAEVTLVDDITLFALWMTEKEIPLTLEFIGSGRITITNAWSTLKFSLNGRQS